MNAPIRNQTRIRIVQYASREGDVDERVEEEEESNKVVNREGLRLDGGVSKWDIKLSESSRGEVLRKDKLKLRISETRR